MFEERHKRGTSRKREALFTLFETNISMFCRLNKQKSQYKSYFKSKTPQRHPSERTLKRCASASNQKSRVTLSKTTASETATLTPCSLSRPFSRVLRVHPPLTQILN